MSNKVQFRSPYEQARDHHGKYCMVLGLQDESLYDRHEVGDLYVVQFNDGVTFEAWPEEIEDYFAKQENSHE